MSGATLIRFGAFSLDTQARTLKCRHGEVPLRPKSFDVLRILCENPGRIVTKEELFAAVWPDVTVSDESLTRCVSDIRKALDDKDQVIVKTIPGRGYALASSVDRTGDAGPTSPALPEAPRLPGPGYPWLATAIAFGKQMRWPRDWRLGLLLASVLCAILAGGLALSNRPGQSRTAAERPAVAVRPFVNLSGDPSQDYLVDGVVEDIITELSRFSSLSVIARNSTARFKDQAVDVQEIRRQLKVGFVLEGSLRKDGDRIRVTSQLIETNTGRLLWADRYDRDFADVLILQNEIAKTVAGLCGAHVNRSELDRASTKTLAAGDAYDHYLKASSLVRDWYASFRDVRQLYEARRLYEQAISLDPHDARSYAGLASTYFSTFLFKYDADFQNPAVLEKIKKLSLKAIELDPNLQDAHGHLGHAYYHSGELDLAIAAHQRAFALNPNRVDYRYAVALVYAGEPQKAIEVSRTSMRLDPFYTPITAGWLGAAHFMKGEYTDALPPLIEATTRASGWRGGHLWLTATYARLGEIEKAKAAAARVLALEPGWTIEKSGRHANIFKHAKDAEHLYGAWRVAGLPD